MSIMKYNLNQICIVPARISDISSRSQCDPLINNKLPLFTAPMSSIINEVNFTDFEDNKINTILPRNIPLVFRLNHMYHNFIAVSLAEFNWIIDQPNASSFEKKYLCIDTANGHMRSILDTCKKAIEIHGDNIVIMAGNIANPETYYEYLKIGINYARIGIGSGFSCTTSANIGVHYPMASLISDCVIQGKNYLSQCELNNVIPNKTFIIADGGFNNFDQIIKALSLGVDYVMLGKILAGCEEACGDKVKFLKSTDKKLHEGRFASPQDTICKRVYYGMSTRKAQKEIGDGQVKTAEGIETYVPITTNLNQWCDNFTSYLRSAMSYTNSLDLNQFKLCQHEIMDSSSYNIYAK